MQLDLEWKWSRKKSYNKADLSKQKWNGPVSCSQHLYFATCPGGGMLAMKVCIYILVFAFSMWCVRCLVWLSIHCFGCWSTPKVILFSWSFHLLLGPRVQSISCKSHKALSFSIWYRWLYFLPLQGEHLLVTAGMFWSSRGFAKASLLNCRVLSNSKIFRYNYLKVLHCNWKVIIMFTQFIV